MKIFTTDQIRTLDRETVRLEGISSLQLMDRAAESLFKGICEVADPDLPVLVVAGPGNNGGDALAVARLLLEAGYTVETWWCSPDGRCSEDAAVQRERLLETGAMLKTVVSTNDLVLPASTAWIIDGLFGSGLNRPLEGFFAALTHWLNQQSCTVLSIDLPSGLFGEDNRTNHPESIVRADLVLGLQFPRLAFLLPENDGFIGAWKLVDIGILPEASGKLSTPYRFTQPEAIRTIFKPRKRHSHKGTFGRTLLIAGSKSMTGAAVLSARAVLRAGGGLVYVETPAAAASVLKTTVPEAIVRTISNKTIELDEAVSDKPTSSASQSRLLVPGKERYTAVAMGPGIGTGTTAFRRLKSLLKSKPEHLVLDADALNLLALHRELMELLPAETILTPHPGEFDRLFGAPAKSGYERLQNARELAQQLRVYLVLKGAYTACIAPDGSCRFNSSGNPGMATAGSGDVLTGIIVSLLSQGYSSEEACVLGVWLHGRSGDLALGVHSVESLLAGDLVENLGSAFKEINDL